MLGKRTSSIQTLILTTLIAGLIWLYAERENVSTYTRQPVQVKVVTPPASGLVVLSPSGAQTVRVSIECSTRQKRAFDELIGDGPIRLMVDEVREGQLEQTATTRDILSAQLAEIGVTLLEVEPTTFSYTVDRLVQEPMNVEPSIQAPAVQATVVEPARVTITLPQSMRSRLLFGRQLTVQVPEEQTADLQVGATTPVELPVSVPNYLQGPYISIEPQKVTVTLTKRRADETTWTLEDPVPVYLSAPPLLLKRYRISVPESQQVIGGVQVTGPDEAIQQIRSGAWRVKAVATFTAEQLNSDNPWVTLQLTLPEGVVASPLPPIEVTVERFEPTDEPVSP